MQALGGAKNHIVMMLDVTQTWSRRHWECSPRPSPTSGKSLADRFVYEWMGSAYGGVGKILGPVGLALIAGSSQIVNPEATIASLTPGFIFLACFAALAGFVYLVLGIETKGKSIEEIDAEQQIKGKRLTAPEPREGSLG